MLGPENAALLGQVLETEALRERVGENVISLVGADIECFYRGRKVRGFATLVEFPSISEHLSKEKPFLKFYRPAGKENLTLEEKVGLDQTLKECFKEKCAHTFPLKEFLWRASRYIGLGGAYYAAKWSVDGISYDRCKEVLITLPKEEFLERLKAHVKDIKVVFAESV